MNLVILKDEVALAEYAADWLVTYISSTLKAQEKFTIALSGGNTPKRLYRLLASDKYRDKIEWKKLHFFWGDERYVPFNDEKNNARMASEALLSHVPVNSKNVHIISTVKNPETDSLAYEELLHSYFDKTEFSFDLILLGLGDNAHTLSLFPGYRNIHENVKWVMEFYLKEQDQHRITLTTPIVNRSKEIVFLVAGGSKAVPLSKILYGEHEPDLYPAQLIQPYKGNINWFVDQAAGMEIKNRTE